MPYEPPLMCPWQCHEIGGPYIAENPDCPFHGDNAEDLTTEEGERLCQEQEAARDGWTGLDYIP